jgi:hypothetical protein
MYLQQGSVKLSVLSSAGKEAIVGVLQPGDFTEKDVWLDSRLTSQPPWEPR